MRWRSPIFFASYRALAMPCAILPVLRQPLPSLVSLRYNAKSLHQPERRTWGTDPAKGPFFKGFAFLPADSAHGNISSSLAISFASRVVILCVDGIIAQPSALRRTGLVHFFQARSGARPTCRRAQEPLRRSRRNRTSQAYHQNGDGAALGGAEFQYKVRRNIIRLTGRAIDGMARLPRNTRLPQQQATKNQNRPTQRKPTSHRVASLPKPYCSSRL